MGILVELDEGFGEAISITEQSPILLHEEEHRLLLTLLAEAREERCHLFFWRFIEEVLHNLFREKIDRIAHVYITWIKSEDGSICELVVEEVAGQFGGADRLSSIKPKSQIKIFEDEEFA